MSSTKLPAGNSYQIDCSTNWTSIYIKKDKNYIKVFDKSWVTTRGWFGDCQVILVNDDNNLTGDLDIEKL